MMVGCQWSGSRVRIEGGAKPFWGGQQQPAAAVPSFASCMCDKRPRKELGLVQNSHRHHQDFQHLVILLALEELYEQNIMWTVPCMH